MKQLTPWIFTIAVALALPAAAQTTGAPGNGSPTRPRAGGTAGDRAGGRQGGLPEVDAITVTGCVTRSDAAASGASDAGGSAPKAAAQKKSAPQFLLIDATASSANATSTGIRPGGASTYVLEGAKVAEHAGQQVQVSGTLVPPGAGSGRASGGSAVAAPASGPAAEGRLRVDSVRMISRTCANRSQ